MFFDFDFDSDFDFELRYPIHFQNDNQIMDPDLVLVLYKDQMIVSIISILVIDDPQLIS